MRSGVEVCLFEASEGLRSSFDCYEGVITVGDYLTGFSVEANSDVLKEQDKSQRDVTENDPRVNGIFSYLDEDETAFTGVIVFVSKIEVLETFQVGRQKAILAHLSSDASTFINDGQGRHVAFSKKIKHLQNQETVNQEQVEQLLNRTLGIKFIVTNTETVDEVKGLIRKLFADIHLNLVKPKTSLSLYFSDAPLCRLLKDICSEVFINQKPLLDAIAVNGKIKKGQVWDLNQFRSLCLTLMDSTPKAANQQLYDPSCYAQWKATISGLLSKTLPLLSLEHFDTDDWKQHHTESLVAKALFAKGLGYLLRSAIEEALENNRKVDYVAFSNLASLPLHQLADPIWLDSNIAFKGTKTVQIAPKSEKVIGSFLCRKLRIYPSIRLTA
ncbi:DGQHR domain-containing protein [Vibrio agarivorans]|uniref:DGQHR domain-containing protein n=1 Tax=Vibrio agarivorans TaxID=153622 RepID=UPI0025B293D8|nr:DGQHR domain-containing protein [Vibrio agarivorans]MDN3661145.1 DGQHR domain-containing protein [Vibrio agarivorans]